LDSPFLGPFFSLISLLFITINVFQLLTPHSIALPYLSNLFNRNPEGKNIQMNQTIDKGKAISRLKTVISVVRRLVAFAHPQFYAISKTGKTGKNSLLS